MGLAEDVPDTVGLAEDVADAVALADAVAEGDVLMLGEGKGAGDESATCAAATFCATVPRDCIAPAA